MKWLVHIDKAMPDQWQAAAWKLERRYYKDYGANAHMRELEERIENMEKNNGREKAEELDKGNAHEKGSTPPGIERCT